MLSLLSSLGKPFMAALLVIVIWQPIRYFINQWRIHRRCQKYPHIVVCTPRKRTIHQSRFDNNTYIVKATKPVILDTFIYVLSQIPILISYLSRSFIVTISTFLLAILWELFQQFSRLYLSLMPRNIASKSEQEGQSVIRSIQLQSLLRRQLHSPTIKPATQQRVVFFVHSNGDVKTQNYFYDPRAEPGVTVSATNSVTPERHPLYSSIATTPPKKDPKILQRIQTPPPRRASSKPRHAPIPVQHLDKENMNNQVQPMSNLNTPLSKESPLSTKRVASKPPLGASSSSTGRNGQKIIMKQPSGLSRASHSQGTPTSLYSNQFAFTSQDYGRRSSTPLSAMIRKRRLEGEFVAPGETKRRLSNSNSNGRIALGSLGTASHRPRPYTSSILSKREREEREAKIWREMNRKRVKSPQAVLPKVSSSQPQSPTVAGTPSFQFGAPSPAAVVASPLPAITKQPTTTESSVTANAPAATPTDQSKTPSATTAATPSFTFGSASNITQTAATAATPETKAPNSSAPSHQFGGTSTTSKTSSTNPGETGTAPSVAAKKPEFQFGRVANATSSAPSYNSTNDPPPYKFGCTPAPATPGATVQPDSTTTTSFQFGSAPAAAVPVATAITSQPTTTPHAPSFQFGSTAAPSFGATPAFGAVPPQPRSSTGGSARRRASRQKRR